jgi:heme-degrading monooxygenase HmoA
MRRQFPSLKKQRGFVDEMVLVSDAEPSGILGISFWNSKADAEQYHREQFRKIHEQPTLLPTQADNELRT